MATSSNPTEDGPTATVLEYSLVDGRSEFLKADLDTIVSALQDPGAPRVGCVVYAFARSTIRSDNLLHFTQIFSDLESSLTHITEGEVEARRRIFDKANW